ncbi:MAG: nuclear transport factor 2 family protein [Hyphomonadaceae bacterium]|nr:nuclear transport factor 2 family protein [Hyphomonadaceae bacterium]
MNARPVLLLSFLLAAALAACTSQPEPESARVAALRRQADALQIETTRAEDIRAIKKLQRIYGYYLEKGQGDDLADLFSSGAEAEYAAGVYVGNENIRAWFRQLGPGNRIADGRISDHMMLQPVVDLAPDGKTAKGRWRALLMAGTSGQSASWGEGAYEIGYVKEAGVWKIDRLHWYQNFIAPYEGGWTKKADAPAGARPARPGAVVPAKPRSDPNQKTWPEAYVPPFHYPDRNVKAGNMAADSPAEVTDASSFATLGPEIEASVRRIERLADEQAVETLQASFGYYFDKKLWGEAIGLFADDATFETGLLGVYAGKESIKRLFASMGPGGLGQGELFHHIELAPVIHVAADGRTAKARVHMIGEIGEHGTTALWRGGIYENGYVKEAGVWKIKSVHFFDTFAASYELGWGKAALAHFDPTDGRAPKADRPPSIVYPVYPNYFLPPFHFANPAAAQPAKAAQPAPSTNSTTSLARAESLITAAERRLQRVRDHDELENLKSAYGYYLDKSLWAEVAGLFAEDGTLEIGGRGVFVGRDKVHQSLSTYGPQGLESGRLFNHIIVQPVITVAPDGMTAKMRSRAMVQTGVYGGAGTWGEGIYEDEFVKVDGVWKFKTLHFYMTFATDYTKGWAKDAMPNTKPNPQYPPDRPPTAVYDTYPAQSFIPPFHYPNPVTGQTYSGAK